MTTSLAIELCDAGLLGRSAEGRLIGPSPGYALFESRELRVGRSARAHARRKPRWVDNRFWDRVDDGSMPRPFPRDLSRAEVAHTHLAQFWQELQSEAGASAETSSAVMAVPGSFSIDQLGLILGIARAAGIPVAGLVDTALAAVAGHSLGARVLHLEVLLHRWIWTELEHDGDLARRRVEHLDGGGLVRVWDAWARRVADLLVRQTRFDPFHHGASEQALYDQLPGCLDQLAREGNTAISLQSQGKERAVEIDCGDIAAVTGRLTAPVIETARSLTGTGQPPVVVLSRRAAGIPGLRQELSKLVEVPVVELAESAVVDGVLQHFSHIESPGSELPLVLRLPVELPATTVVDPPPSPGAPPLLAARGPQPTHLLIAGQAHAITGDPLWLGSAIAPGARGIRVGEAMPGLSRMHACVQRWQGQVMVEDHSRYGSFLNGIRIQSRTAARVGDRLQLGSPGVELLFILVSEQDV